MVAVAHRFEHRLEANRPVRRTVWRAVSFGHGILQPHLDQVDAEGTRDFVNQRLGRECSHRRSRRTIGGDLRLVDHHIEGFDEEIGDVVRRERAHGASPGRRSAVGARLVIQRCRRGDDRAVLLRAHLHPDLRGRGRARGAEHLVARHHHLDRALRHAREHDRERLQVHGNLPAEPAADLAWRDLDVRCIEPEDHGGRIAHQERTLRACPDVDAAVLVHAGDAGMRLDVSLVTRGRAEHALHDDVGLGKALLDVAARQFHPTRDVGGSGLLHRRPCLGHHVVVQDRGIRVHRPVHAHHRLEHVVLDLHQTRSLACRSQGRGSNRRHGVAVIQHLGARQEVVRHVFQVHRAFAHPELGVGQHDVLAGHHRFRTRNREDAARVDRHDARMRVRTAYDHAVQHARQRQVGAVVGAPRHLVDAVVTNRPCADCRERSFAHARALLMSAAAERTARTILS